MYPTATSGTAAVPGATGDATAGAVSARVDGVVCYVSMDRGDSRNALSNEMKIALVEQLRDYEQDDSARVMILSGCDCGAFSAGGDLQRVHGRLTRGLPITDPEAPDVFAALMSRTKPIIAAVDGFALGGGLEMAIACDLRVATTRSRFGMPEPRAGMLGGYGLNHLARVMPLGEALRLQLTGGQIGAERAHSIGLVQELASSRAEMFEKAAALAAEIARCSPTAVRTIRHVVMTGVDLPSRSAERFSEPYREAVHSSADALEGVTAFLEKRKPSWVMEEI
jgi:enoyl-CoA hydratase/carnithine racemase